MLKRIKSAVSRRRRNAYAHEVLREEQQSNEDSNRTWGGPGSYTHYQATGAAAPGNDNQPSK